MKKLLGRVIPWAVTVVALYIAFQGVEWPILLGHLKSASLPALLLAFLLTVLSYLLRARRWQHLFPSHIIGYWDAWRVLVLGFFMNNILPARAGEFVRAHLGSKVTGETRTLVLATVASERLADGLTLSLIFVAFSLGLGDPVMSQNLLYVAYMFAGATLLVAIVLLNRGWIFVLSDRLSTRFENRASRYASDRLQVFLNGLSPLYTSHKLPFLVLWSVVIWSVELAVYVAVQNAFGAQLSLSTCVLFMVTVNFSSLIPAAPGAIGVIEAAASAVLVSVGVDKEHALSMVISQHAIQYLAVGAPGAWIMLNWKKRIEKPAQADENIVDEQLQEQSIVRR